MDEGQPTQVEEGGVENLEGRRTFQGVYAETVFDRDEAKFSEIKKDNHEIVSHKVQWIIRCHCSEKF